MATTARSSCLLAVLACVVIAAAGGTRADDAAGGDDDAVTRGRAIAERNCGRCHALGRTGPSPLAEAPPFRTFARRWPLESLEEAFAEGIVTGHPDMPEFVFAPDEIGDLIAYLAAIGEPDPPR